MKLASFRAEGRERIGLGLADGSLVDLLDAVDAVEGPAAASAVPPEMMALIRAGDAALALLRRAAAETQSNSRVRRFSAEEVTWRPPVRTPSKIVCIALNNRALDKVKIRAPTDHPAFFLKPSTALTGHGQPVRLRPAFGLTHPEPELAVVIGTQIKNVAPADVPAAVFGYTVMNDITCVGMREEDSFSVRYYRPDPETGKPVPDVGHTSYPGRYKASDTFAPLGPWLVTRDEIPDPADLRIRCWLGERLVASDHSRNYVWDVANAISQVTRTMTLLPGDVVSMGTAVGGDEDDPDQPDIPGVTRANLNGYQGAVTVTIDGLGTLTNPIETEA